MKILNPGHRREGTPSLYYILLREPEISGPSQAGTTYGVPLDPAWPQDHARMGGDPDLDPENPEKPEMPEIM